MKIKDKKKNIYKRNKLNTINYVDHASSLKGRKCMQRFTGRRKKDEKRKKEKKKCGWKEIK